MKVKRISYEACLNLGDYSNEKIRLEADIDDTETVEDVVAQLRAKVLENATPSVSKVWEQIDRLKTELRVLTDKVTTKRQQWNDMAEFLRAQGINTDAPDMPLFNNLIAPGHTIDSEQVEEIEFFSDDIPL